MVYTERKKIGNNYYFYSKKSYRDESGKVHTKHVKYLGKSATGKIEDVIPTEVVQASVPPVQDIPKIIDATPQEIVETKPETTPEDNKDTTL